MSTKDFLTGFMQGFNEAGGTQKLSSWAGQNIEEGKYYDPMEDPVALQEYQRAIEGPEPAQEQFAQEYGEYVDTGEQSPQEYFFNKQEKVWGMPLQQARETLLGVTEQGGDYEELASQFNRQVGEEDKISSDVLSAFAPEEPSRMEEMIQNPMYQAAAQGDERAQRMVVEEYPDIASRFTNQNNFPRRSMGEQATYDTMAQAMFPDEEKGLSDIEKATTSSIRQLSSEERKQLEDQGFDVESLPTDPNYQVVKEPLVEQTDEYAAYQEMDPIQLAQTIMMDDEVTKEEEKIWSNLPYSSFGSPEEFAQMGQGQQTTVDLGLITGDENLRGNEMPLESASQYMDLLNKAQKYRQGTISENEYHVDISKITGNPDHKQVPIDRAEQIVGLQGDIQSLRGEGQDPAINQNRRVTKAPDGRWLSKNMAGNLVYEDTGEPFIDDEGNRYYIGESMMTNEQAIKSTGDKNIFDEGDLLSGGSDGKFADKQEDDSGGFINTLVNLYNNITGNNNAEPQQSSPAPSNNRSGADQVIQTYKSNNPDLSYKELADKMRNQSDEWKRNFEENYGVTVNSVLGRLQLME